MITTSMTVRLVPIGCDRARICPFRASCSNGYRAHIFDYSSYSPFRDWTNYLFVAFLVIAAVGFVALHAALVYALQSTSVAPHFCYMACYLATGVLDAVFFAGYCLWDNIGSLAIRGSFYVLFAVAWLVIELVLIYKKICDNIPSIASFGSRKYQRNGTAVRRLTTR
ncbi:MAG: hypothetical protein P4L61_02420 [Candidatus Pacebacteria bacterium]|nr:hypothetical protein [Candidatus Paceibacterota bacterium]